MTAWQEFCKLLKDANVEVTFSINCCSGLLKRCECWRCRKERGEEVTAETETLAAQQSEVARRENSERQRQWVQEHMGKPEKKSDGT